MDLNKHPRNYIQLRNQIFKLKKKSLPPAIKRIIKKKKKQRNLAKTQPHIFADSLVIIIFLYMLYIIYH